MLLYIYIYIFYRYREQDSFFYKFKWFLGKKIIYYDVVLLYKFKWNTLETSFNSFSTVLCSYRGIRQWAVKIIFFQHIKITHFFGRLILQEERYGESNFIIQLFFFNNFRTIKEKTSLFSLEGKIHLPMYPRFSVMINS